MPSPELVPADPALALQQINDLPPVEFVALLGEIVEHSPWVIERAAGRRPFASVWAFHEALQAVMREASADAQRQLAVAHPELAGREALAGEMTDDSNREQARLGLTRLSPEAHRRLTRLNRDYRARFGYPFITAVRLHRDLDSIFREFDARLGNSPATELAVTVGQIGEVVRGRLARRFGVACGWLSTHVLDAGSGRPAAGVAYELAMQQPDGWWPVGHGRTNAFGRTDAPILVDRAMQAGTYQLEFHVGEYFRGQGAAGAGTFLETVPVRFVIDAPDDHYHVPLLCTPFSYSTYRGS